MYAINKGDNAGWPYIYYDQEQKKKILAPEYGGDGKKEGDSKFINPVAAYPGHLAPNGLLFYTGDQFPENIKMALLLPSMVHGTVHLNHRQVSL
jgi:glucose/arabinose dehydrogenase